MGEPAGTERVAVTAETARLARAYKALVLCNGHVVRARSEAELLERLCEVLVSVGGYPLAWVGLVEAGVARVRPVAVGGTIAGRAYLAEIEVATSGDDILGRGPVGTAIRTGAVAVNRDSATNPAFGPWREAALRAGLRSSIALPLRDEAGVFGALSVYAGSADAFDEEERALLGSFADDLAYGVAALRARRALAATEDELRAATSARARFAILDEAPSAFAAIDRAWRCVYVNPLAADLLGHPSEAIVGHVVWDVFPEGIRTAFWDAFHRAMEQREQVALEAYYPPLDRWFEARAYPIEVGIAIYFQDIGARRALEQSVRESEERFRQVAESIEDVVWLSDAATGRPIYVSPAFETIWGRPRAGLYPDGAAWDESIHPDDRARMKAARARQPHGPYDEEYRIVRPDGQTRIIRARTYPVRDAAGAIVRLAGVARDLTAQRRLEEQVHQSQKLEAIGRLAGGVAHDFNNVLSVILSYAELIELQLAPGSPMRADVGEILRAGRRASELTHHLLAFSRQQVLEPRLLDLGDSLAAMKKLLDRLLGEHINLVFAPAPALWRVRADAGQLEMLVMNLAINARDAMPGGGTLTIATGNLAPGDEPAAPPALAGTPCVWLEVTDTGVGIDPATQARIFEPFFTTKDKGKGTGLGLATVYGIVKQSGGEIVCTSERGAGTTFRIYLPRADEAPAAPRDARVAATPSPRGQETILLVEDDAPLRAILGGVLGQRGYTVLAAGDGEAAVRLAAAHPGRIDLLLTDVVMPSLGGADVAACVTDARPEVRVIFMSGYTDDEIVRHGVSDAGVPYLQKPITPAELLRKVREVLDGAAPPR